LVFAVLAPGAVDFDALYQDRYPAEVFLPQGQRKMAKSAQELRLLEGLTKGRRILDVGSSYGFFLAIAAERGWSAAGIELSAADAEHARREYNLEIFIGRLEDSPYPPGSFDVVAIRHVLEHVPDPTALLAQARYQLKEGGLLLVAVPNIRSLPALLYGADWWWIDPPTHLFCFDRQSLTRCLRLGGFDVIHAETTRGDDQHTAFYAIFVANMRLRLMERIRPTRDAHSASLTDDYYSSLPNRELRSAARWAMVRKVIDAIAVPARPIGLALDRLGLGSEILMVARAAVRAPELRS
jgi:SAM-dependent methyltransferase